MPRILLLALAMLWLVPGSARAQHLRDRVADLFTFGDCGRALCLDGSINAANGHGDHFIPDAISGTATLIGFLNAAIASAAGAIPLSASSAGVTFKFVNGFPVRTSNSNGSVFGERGQTLGQGRVLLGANLIGVNFATLRGVPLGQLEFNLAHQDVDPQGLGEPVLENEVIAMDMSLNMNLLVSTFVATYGLSDRIDVGIAVPLVHTSLQGRSTARILPFGANPAHFFTGTPDNPGLTARSATFGSATGLGDVAIRLKGNLLLTDRVAFALAGDARLPTGNEEDLLGAGSASLRSQAVLSLVLGGVEPHLNLGYLLRGGDQPDAVLTTLGFESPLAPWASLAVDVLSEWQVGDSPFTIPEPIEFALPFKRTLASTNLPERRDHRVLGTLGFRFQTPGGPMIVASGLVPLKAGQLEPRLAWTLGLEFNF